VARPRNLLLFAVKAAFDPREVRLACQAMATRFEIVMHGADVVALRAAGEEAIEEIQRLDRQLSLYRPDSEIGRLNALAHREPVRVSPSLFELLEQARRLGRDTEGAFDITVGPLLSCWGLRQERGRVPSAEALAEARACVGMHLVEMDLDAFTVRFARKGVMLDLGAVGKGYAVERASAVLREAGVTSAFVHGGTSSIYAIGQPPGQEAWKVTLEFPAGWEKALRPTPSSAARTMKSRALPKPGGRAAASGPVAVVSLRDESLSVSAVWGKAFLAGRKVLGHVLDPRTGAPAERAIMAAVAVPSATESDALSTALLTLGAAGHATLAAIRPGARTFTIERRGTGIACEGHGIVSLGNR
jgi:FAD:protein FMN transferase